MPDNTDPNVIRITQDMGSYTCSNSSHPREYKYVVERDFNCEKLTAAVSHSGGASTQYLSVTIMAYFGDGSTQLLYQGNSRGKYSHTWQLNGKKLDFIIFTGSSSTTETCSVTFKNLTLYQYKEVKPMPVTGAQIQFKSGTSAGFAQITPDASTFYYLTDTQQIFLGSSEYTKSTHVLNAAPTESTPGDIGSLYAYNGNLYLCSAIDNGVYTYVRVANVNDVVGSVTSVGAGAGLATASGDDNPITSTGTIVHAVPTGASTHSSTASATQTLDFGDTFELETVDTDEFGHVTGFHTTTVTMPANPDTDTTYSISSDSEGTITLTPSEGSAETITIDGWSDLAKKSEIAAVFKFKGTVATVAALPTDGEVGDVWHVTAANAEYVCVQAGTTDPQVDAVWEELGTDIDLSGYVEKVTGATAGNVANLTADGSIADSGFTIGISVPADAVFTDTTYENATTAEAGLMSAEDKAKLDGIEPGGEVNIIDSISVASTAIAPDANKNVNIELSNFGLTVDAADLNQLDGKLSTASNVLTVDGDITGNAATADFADAASTATYDVNGDQIDTTYAKLTDLQWQAF